MADKGCWKCQSVPRRLKKKKTVGHTDVRGFLRWGTRTLNFWYAPIRKECYACHCWERAETGARRMKEVLASPWGPLLFQRTPGMLGISFNWGDKNSAATAQQRELLLKETASHTSDYQRLILRIHFFKGKKEDAPAEQLIHAANGWAVNIQFSKEESQMARTYVSRCPAPGKSEQNYSEIPSHLSMAKVNKTKGSKHWWGCWTKRTICTADGSVHRHSHWANL